MPKGDRLKLKADPEDGTTPIANLLLEAVAMAKFSGLQKGAIIFLWRKTYGWVGDDGKRLKEAKITLGDWTRALDRDKSRVSKALSELCGMNILHRRVADTWGGYYYSLNTNIASWNSNSINLAKLADTAVMAHLPTVGENATVGDNDYSKQKVQQLAKSTTVGENIDATVGENATQQLAKTPLPTLYKETLNKDKEKDALRLLRKSPPEYINLTKQVFAGIKTRREYTSRNPAAEAMAIHQMFDEKYSPDDILKAYDLMKTQPFWQDKNLSLMKVRNDIHEVLKGGTHQQNNETSESRKRQAILEHNRSYNDPRIIKG